VRRFERFGDLLCDRQRVVERNRATGDPVREIFAVDKLHDEGRRRLEYAEHLRDVGMIQGGERLRFTLEAQKAIVIGCEHLRQSLDRHVPIEFGIARASA